MANVIKIKRGAKVPTTNAQLAPGEIGFNTTDDSLYMNKGTDIEPDIVRVGEDANSILTKIKTVDGASSGLDADLLDGKHASAFSLDGHTQDWTTITGKPTTFAPSAHNQAWSTITSRPANSQFPTTAEAIGASKNLNDYTTPGFYYQSANASAASGSNYPVARAGTLIVTKDAGTTQMYYEYNGSGVYYRTFYSSTWTAWQNLVAPKWANVSSKPTTATRWPTWSEVTSKPSTFTPSSHNHSGANITSGTVPVARLGMTVSNALNGYVKLPGGLILQWGRQTFDTGRKIRTFNFPIAFPSYCRSFVPVFSTTTGVDGDWLAWATVGKVNSKSSASIFVRAGDDNVPPGTVHGYAYWLAVGY